VETIINKEDRKMAGSDKRSEVLQKLVEELGGIKREVIIRIFIYLLILMPFRSWINRRPTVIVMMRWRLA
jgi:hypothetical protein